MEAGLLNIHPTGLVEFEQVEKRWDETGHIWVFKLQKKKKKIYPNKYQLENKWRRQHNLCSKILYNKMKYLGIN